MLFARCTGRRESGPGPGSYDTRSRNAGPQFTIKGRYSTSNRHIDAPYRTLPTTVGSGPRYSLGSRHSQRSSFATPGPSYVPPPLGSDSKKVTMSHRQRQARDPREGNPGPGAYNIQSRFANDAQKSTLHSRTNTNTDGQSISPGPAAYMPNDDAVRKKARASSIHLRTRTRERESTPGYCYNGSTLRGPRFTIGRREELDLVMI